MNTGTIRPSTLEHWDNIKNWLSRNLKGDIVIWVIVAILSLVSLLIVYSATGTLAYQRGGGYPETFLFKHIFYTSMGLFVMWWVCLLYTSRCV